VKSEAHDNYLLTTLTRWFTAQRGTLEARAPREAEVAVCPATYIAKNSGNIVGRNLILGICFGGDGGWVFIGGCGMVNGTYPCAPDFISEICAARFTHGLEGCTATVGSYSN
jgi:hypothetical protein